MTDNTAIHPDLDDLTLYYHSHDGEMFDLNVDGEPLSNVGELYEFAILLRDARGMTTESLLRVLSEIVLEADVRYRLNGTSLASVVADTLNLPLDLIDVDETGDVWAKDHWLTNSEIAQALIVS